MSTTVSAAKKPLATAAAGRRTPNSNNNNPPSNPTPGTPARTPSGLASTNPPANNAATVTPHGVSRTRSIRNGAPVSARAAVRKPTTPDSAAEEEAKAEMQARIDELQERLQHAERQFEESHKQAAVLQVKLDEAHKEQGLLEESVHEHTERIEDLENEKKESLRARREMEQIYESERAATMKEKEEATVREEEMQNALQRVKESLAQREMRAGLFDEDRLPSPSRQASFRASNNASPNPDSASTAATAADRQFAPSSVQRSDSSSRSNSKLVMQKDKIIESLRLELAEAQIKLVEVENMGGGRMQEQQKQIYDLKMQNARLMEENESFQLLLSEKTLNGDFLRPPSRSHSRPPSSRIAEPSDAGGGTGASLADELEAHADVESGEEDRRLQGEVNGLKDQNKALTLYINNIISRLLQHEQFEQILDKTPDLISGPSAAARRYFESDKDKELPPPPPSDRDDKSGDEQAGGFLQRAKSVMGGIKPRPLSQIHGGDQSLHPPTSQAKADEVHTVHENPETAPSVPLGRSRSMRNTSGHRRANSEWPAGSVASVVTNMYRGPSTGVGGPLSPGLTSPTQRNSFFAGQFPRQPSHGSTLPTIAGAADKENAGPQRDSKFSSIHSNRNSIISNPATGAIDGLDSSLDSGTTNSLFSPASSADRPSPSSPPRSIASSSGDRDMKSSGAIMMGSRMRPLRLVQETATVIEQDEAARNRQAGANGSNSGSNNNNNNRGSWFGWMNKGPVTALGNIGSGVGGGGMVGGSNSSSSSSGAAAATHAPTSISGHGPSTSTSTSTSPSPNPNPGSVP